MTPFLAIPTLVLAMGLHGNAAVEGPVNWKQFAEDHRAEITNIQVKLQDMREQRQAEHSGLSADNRAAVTTALEAGDYQAFIEATSQAPFADLVTAEKFDAMVEARELLGAGDKEAAKQTLLDAGIKHKPSRARWQRFTPNRTQHQVELEASYNLQDSLVE